MGCRIQLRVLLVTFLVAAASAYCIPDDECWPSHDEINSFGNTLMGGIYFQGESVYDQYVKTKNGRVEKHPVFLVLVQTTADVQKSVRFARKFNISLAIQSSGHGFIGRSTCDDCMQINLGAMKEITFDLFSQRNQDGEITVQSGCSWKDIYEEADTHGRVVLGGSAHTVSPGGYTLGGGHSPVSRSLGLAVDNVLEFEMVDVDGNLVKSTAGGTDIKYENGTTATSSDADLFWALRGGGGGTFGVVTKFTFKLHQPPSQVVKFFCGYAMTYNKDVIGWNIMKTFTGLIEKMPSKWGGYMILVGVPVTAEIFGPILFVLNHYGALTEEDKTYLEPIYSQCPNYTFTEYDTFYAYEETITDEEFTWMYIFNTFMSANNFTDEWLKFVFNEMGTRYSTGAAFACTGALIGGKVKEVGTKETAVHPAFRSSDVSLTCGLSWPEDSSKELNYYYGMEARKLGEKLQTFGNGVYMNEPAADLEHWQQDFWGSNYDRLYEIKQKWDPDNFLTCRYCVGSGGSSSLQAAVAVVIAVNVFMTMMLKM
ncbi:hypothetical protein ScPMuIL_013469 [Solemya velum]